MEMLVTKQFMHDREAVAFVEFVDGKGLLVTVLDPSGWTAVQVGKVFGSVEIEPVTYLLGGDKFTRFFVRGWGTPTYF